MAVGSSREITKLIDEILTHCAFALGSGAGMPIKRHALIELKKHVAPHFKEEIFVRPKDKGKPDDPEPGIDRWHQMGPIILEYTRGIGRMAAYKAILRGSLTIDLEDLEVAYAEVRKHQPLAGNYCPDWDPGSHG